MTSKSQQTKQRKVKNITTSHIEDDPNHHLAGPFLPQTPLGSLTPERSASPIVPNGKAVRSKHISPWLRWAVRPSSAFKLLLFPLIFFVNWEALSPYLVPGSPNPFRSIIFISNRVTSPTSDRPLYGKSYLDLVFIAYYVIFFSFVRQIVTIKLCRPVAKYFGIKREAKLDRFGEQGYAMLYFAVFGAWGYRIMKQLPTWWYRTEFFWIDYPHWAMIPELKCYYLMQSSYWCQQLLVLALGLEKPRKDYWELVAHHIVTLWLIGWSYLINLTLIGNAVYMSMDIPDTFLAFSKLLNYIQWEKAKVASFVVFIGVWTYFRHYLNLRMLWSVWYEYDLRPEASRAWSWTDGAYLLSWMRYQVFMPLLLLQLLNLFWYYLIIRILLRAIFTDKATDDRSDDEDEGENDSKDD